MDLQKYYSNRNLGIEFMREVHDYTRADMYMDRYVVIGKLLRLRNTPEHDDPIVWDEQGQYYYITLRDNGVLLSHEKFKVSKYKHAMLAKRAANEHYIKLLSRNTT